MRPLRLHGCAVALISCLISLTPIHEAQAQLQWFLYDTWRNAFVYDLECAPDGTCIVAGDSAYLTQSKVRMSSDAGHTWRDILSINSAHPRFPLRTVAVEITEQHTVFVGCDSGTIAVTSDLGTTWDYRRVIDSGMVSSLSMIDESRGLAVFNFSRPFILVTTDDAWATAHRIELPDSVHFEDSTRYFDNSNVSLTGAARMDADRISIVLEAVPNTAVAITSDRGVTWTQQPLGAYRLRSVRFADSLNGWIWGGPTKRQRNMNLSSVVRTIDGGRSWQKCLDGPRLSDLSCKGSMKVLAVGDELSAFASTNGGLTWRRDTCPIRGAVIPMCALPDTGDGVIVTSFGDIMLPERQSSSVVDVLGTKANEVSIQFDAVEEVFIINHRATDSEIVFKLYDASGRLIRTNAVRRITSTRSIVAMSSTDVSSGMYFANITARGVPICSVRMIRQ